MPTDPALMVAATAATDLPDETADTGETGAQVVVEAVEVPALVPTEEPANTTYTNSNRARRFSRAQRELILNELAANRFAGNPDSLVLDKHEVTTQSARNWIKQYNEQQEALKTGRVFPKRVPEARVVTYPTLDAFLDSRNSQVVAPPADEEPPF